MISSHRPIQRLARAALLALLLLCAPTAHADDREPLQFWAVTGAHDDVPMFRELARRFEEQTGIAVEVTNLSWGNFLTKYFTAMASGEPPDVGLTNTSGPFEYGSVGGVIDLYETFGDRARALADACLPGLLPVLTIDGKLYGLPNDVTTALIYYRTDVFQQLGITRLDTWADLAHAIDTIEARGLRFLYGWPRTYQWALPQFTLPYGKTSFRPITTPDGRASSTHNWLDPDYQKGVRAAVDFWYTHDLVDRDLPPRGIGWFKTDDPAYQAPLMIDLSFYYGRIRALAPELEGRWDVAPWPRADDGQPASVVGGGTLVIFRRSDRHDDAFRWLEFLLSLESQRFIVAHRMHRGEASEFLTSPVRAFWTEQNADFWEIDANKPYKRMGEVMGRVVQTLQTVPYVHGDVEASRLEQSQVLDRIESDISARLQSIADRLGLSRRDVLRGMASGDLATERDALDQWIAQRLAELYTAAAPQAAAILDQAARDYDERYRDIVDQLADYERRPDIMRIALWASAGVLALAAAAVALVPSLRQHVRSYLFIAPPLILVGLFVVVPALVALYLSFTEYHPVLPLSSARWTGPAQYLSLITQSALAPSLLRTTAFVAAWLPLTLTLSLLIACLLNTDLAAKPVWRFVFFAPLVTSIVSVALIFSQIFRSDADGWINGMLATIGLTERGSPIRFLNSEQWFLPCIIIVSIWTGLAFNILVYLAGLQQIPKSLYEASTIDGAGPAGRFLNVSLPGLKPQIFFTVVMSLISGYQVFEPIYMLGGGSGEAGSKFGPNDSGLTMVPLMYHYGFERLQMGHASAVAYILFTVIFMFTLFQLRLFKGGMEVAR